MARNLWGLWPHCTRGPTTSPLSPARVIGSFSHMTRFLELQWAPLPIAVQSGSLCQRRDTSCTKIYCPLIFNSCRHAETWSQTGIIPLRPTLSTLDPLDGDIHVEGAEWMGKFIENVQIIGILATCRGVTLWMVGKVGTSRGPQRRETVPVVHSAWLKRARRALQQPSLNLN